ncbi:MAG: hypothetical protein MJA84_00340 [Firmicutes bacterium]|nr:hypothetical protein [Bacillota bacterium]
MRIKKVKITAAGKIMIVYEKRSQGAWDEYSLSCSEAARPEFYAALGTLAPHVVEMCELPKNYVEKIKVRGVSFSYGGEKEVMGATISASMELRDSYPDLNLNTPHKASEMYSDSPPDEKQLLTDRCTDDLEYVQDECQVYIRGDRAQGTLKFGDVA